LYQQSTVSTNNALKKQEKTPNFAKNQPTITLSRSRQKLQICKKSNQKNHKTSQRTPIFATKPTNNNAPENQNQSTYKPCKISTRREQATINPTH
jgi:hypothetical protein